MKIYPSTTYPEEKRKLGEKLEVGRNKEEEKISRSGKYKK